ELLALLALGWMAWSVVHVGGLAPWYYRGGLITFALASVVVIYVVTGGPPGPLARAISWRPPVALGALSYGVYLGDWPVIVFLDEHRVGIDGLALDAVRVVVTLIIAIASYVVVERPIRRGTFSAASARRLLAGGVAVTLVVILVALGGTPISTA